MKGDVVLVVMEVQICEFRDERVNTLETCQCAVDPVIGDIEVVFFGKQCPGIINEPS